MPRTQDNVQIEGAMVEFALVLEESYVLKVVAARKPISTDTEVG